MWLDSGREVLLVLNDAGDHKFNSGALCYLNCFVHALVRMDATKEQEVLTLGVGKWKLCDIDTVMDRRDVVEFR